MEIEYYYASYSAYAYLGNAEMHAIARRTDATIKYIPMDLRAVMPAAGSQIFADRSKAHKDYFFGREMIRWAEHRGLEMMDRIPTHHGNNITLSNCILIAADKSGADMEQLTNVMMHAHWVEDADLDNEADLKDICKRAHVDGEELIVAAKTPEIMKIYQSNTKEAIHRHVFGSPTYYVGGDMFYGQDRLQMVERALLKPYKGEWPR
jgi:2-hydroxychromene-2-carboxylate isomerase